MHAGMHCVAVDERRSNCSQRCGQCARIPGSHFVATLEWISPPKPCRNEDVLYETTRPIVDGAGLRQAGRGNPNPHHRSQSLHGPWYTCHGTCRVSASGERGRTSFTRFVQQSRVTGCCNANSPKWTLPALQSFGKGIAISHLYSQKVIADFFSCKSKQ
jgi:hypothetical protein